MTTITKDLAVEFARQYDDNALRQILTAADKHCELLREQASREYNNGTLRVGTDEHYAFSEAQDAFGQLAYNIGRVLKLAKAKR